MIEKQIEVSTPDGRMPTFVVHPERGGPFPAIVIYMDARGVREELRDMARRFATVGYYCLLPDIYYRWGKDIAFDPTGSLDQKGPEERARLEALVAKCKNGLVVSDTEALLGYLKNETAASAGPKGCVGYCMGGRFVVSAMGALPEHFHAGSSLFGVSQYTDQPDSPHLLAGRIRGGLYLGFGALDKLTPAREIQSLGDALTKANVDFEIEVHDGATHGFAFAQRTATYHKVAAERTWERTFALFQRRLGRN